MVLQDIHEQVCEYFRKEMKQTSEGVWRDSDETTVLFRYKVTIHDYKPVVEWPFQA